MNGLAPRTVEHDTTITVDGQNYAIRKGDIIFIVTASVHKNPEIYEDPYDFRLQRFMPLHNKTGTDQYQSYKVFNKSGHRVRNPFIWWGGGQHIVNFSSRLLLTSLSVAAASLLSER